MAFKLLENYSKNENKIYELLNSLEVKKICINEIIKLVVRVAKTHDKCVNSIEKHFAEERYCDFCNWSWCKAKINRNMTNEELKKLTENAFEKCITKNHKYFERG